MRIASLVLACLGGLLLVGCGHDAPPPQPISFDQLPPAVRQSITHDFPDIHIQGVERVPQKDGPDFYRLHFIGTNGQKQDILYNPQGIRRTTEYQMNHPS